MATTPARMGGFGAILGLALGGALGATFIGVPGGVVGAVTGLIAGWVLLGWLGRSLDRAPDYRSQPRVREDPAAPSPPYSGLEDWERHPPETPPDMADRH